MRNDLRAKATSAARLTGITVPNATRRMAARICCMNPAGRTRRITGTRADGGAASATVTDSARVTGT